eukprot:Seg1765.4 transcript_id=Seg1765.4/GoldUCD/mRNA.D3Y31 product="hypothetical protein" pseudo=true protein_id=Seg1765.4/GoldUCD/D3Y31
MCQDVDLFSSSYSEGVAWGVCASGERSDVVVSASCGTAVEDDDCLCESDELDDEDDNRPTYMQEEGVNLATMQICKLNNEFIQVY